MALDKYTKDQAIEYADNEAEVHGYDRNNPRWKKEFDEYCNFAVGTMSVGRNPRNLRNPTVASIIPYFPEIFAENGVAGQFSKHWPGGRIPSSTVSTRIMTACTNIVKLFEAGRMGKKVKAAGRPGLIDDSEMSAFQLPKKGVGETKEQYALKSREVLKQWITRDLLTALFLESIMPFLTMTRDDVEQIYNFIDREMQNKLALSTIQDYQTGGSHSPRNQLLTELHKVFSNKKNKIDFRQILIGGATVKPVPTKMTKAQKLQMDLLALSKKAIDKEIEAGRMVGDISSGEYVPPLTWQMASGKTMAQIKKEEAAREAKFAKARPVEPLGKEKMEVERYEHITRPPRRHR